MFQDPIGSIALVLAQAAPSGAPPASQPPGGALGILANPMWMMLLIFAAFYFLILRPQSKKQRELEQWLKSLRKGDEVVTSGGIIGKISGLTEQTVTLEVQEKVRVRVLRTAITGKAPGAQPDKAADKVADPGAGKVAPQTQPAK